MDINTARNVLEPWFTMKEGEIFDKFTKECRGDKFSYGKDYYRSLYIPGTRPNAVLLVAHVDTVAKDSPHVKVGYEDGVFFSANRESGLNKKGFPYVNGTCLGADDRAGVALVHLFKDLGHSILLTAGEEDGCLGALHLIGNPEIAHCLQQHSFALQFDRRGRNDLVFYGVETPEFEKFCVENTGYVPADGSFTDICVICEDICGVNISVGYKNEHTPNERLVVRHWIRTYETVLKLLSLPKLPRFCR